MRRVLHCDLTAAARGLLRVPPVARAAVLRAWLAQAQAADRHVRRLRRLHPAWGDGTLAGRVRQHALPPEPALNDPEYLACLALVLEVLRAKSRRHQAARQSVPRARRCDRACVP